MVRQCQWWQIASSQNGSPRRIRRFLLRHVSWRWCIARQFTINRMWSGSLRKPVHVPVCVVPGVVPVGLWIIRIQRAGEDHMGRVAPASDFALTSFRSLNLKSSGPDCWNWRVHTLSFSVTRSLQRWYLIVSSALWNTLLKHVQMRGQWHSLIWYMFSSVKPKIQTCY